MLTILSASALRYSNRRAYGFVIMIAADGATVPVGRKRSTASRVPSLVGTWKDVRKQPLERIGSGAPNASRVATSVGTLTFDMMVLSAQCGA
ncbi:MAG: hypothetical protein NVSMB48_00240 [Marmoricola sp.]